MTTSSHLEKQGSFDNRNWQTIAVQRSSDDCEYYDVNEDQFTYIRIGFVINGKFEQYYFEDRR